MDYTVSVRIVAMDWESTVRRVRRVRRIVRRGSRRMVTFAREGSLVWITEIRRVNRRYVTRMWLRNWG